MFGHQIQYLNRKKNGLKKTRLLQYRHNECRVIFHATPVVTYSKHKNIRSLMT